MAVTKSGTGTWGQKGELAEESNQQIVTITCAGDRQFGSEMGRKGKKPLRGK